MKHKTIFTTILVIAALTLSSQGFAKNNKNKYKAQKNKSGGWQVVSKKAGPNKSDVVIFSTEDKKTAKGAARDLNKKNKNVMDPTPGGSSGGGVGEQTILH